MSRKKINIDILFCYGRKHKEFTKKSKLTWKAQQRFKSENHNVFTEGIDKNVLSSNDDKRM